MSDEKYPETLPLEMVLRTCEAIRLGYDVQIAYFNEDDDYGDDQYVCRSCY